MMLTGAEIRSMRKAGQLVVEPYDDCFLEPNSYGFHLGEKLMRCDADVVDPKVTVPMAEITIPESGYVLYPRTFYLGHTLERIGGVRVAAELFANLSTASMGMWVQTSAPLGHVGAVINWTLEICVTQPIRVYPRMRLGKICFWQNYGNIDGYKGRYLGSTSTVASRAFLDKS